MSAGGRDGCEPWMCGREAAVPTVHETHTWGRSIATWRAERFCFPPLPRPQGLYLAPNSAARLWSRCWASPGKQLVLPAPAPPPPALESSPQVGRAGPASNRLPVPLRLHRAAREAWLRARRYCEQGGRWLPVSISPLISAEGRLPVHRRGSALSALEVFLQGALSGGWGKHPAGRPRATFPLVRSPGASASLRS